MARYQIISLIDITRSKATRSESDRLRVGQQANFNSLIQAIGMRANVEWTTDPKFNDGILPFPLTGKCIHWSWEFETEHDYIFHKGDDPTGHLADDLNGVPIITNLNNSMDIHPAAFQTYGNSINTWVKIIS